MKKTLFVLGLAAGASFVSASVVSAQSASPATEKFYVNVNFGVQSSTHDVITNASIPVYDETATLVADNKVTNGAVIDFGGGYRVYQDIHVGFTYTHFTNTQDGTYAASVPDPLVFDHPKTSSGTIQSLKRSEGGFDPYVLWVTPLTNKLDVSGAVGLAIITVSQELIQDFTVPAGTQDVVVNRVKEKKTGTGFYAAADFMYNIAPRYGVGGFLRYAGANVTFDNGTETKAGGFQVGGGVRLHF